MKVLRSLTVIPSALYVERSADRQLEAVIENMGRPGYVLVARQMGKTNLLLNAKRRRDGTQEVFTYLDVSNPFPDIRSFFRNVIDLTLETAPAKLAGARLMVNEERRSSDRLPHKEHEWELKCILQSGIDKLIVCFDEIDALTRSEYSDQVFSFIRSVYFSGRVNFEEFQNLTYLLSGVAEPADIIKNKDISPFNIGEKIYLEDFNLLETTLLLSKANVTLPDQVVARIYEWVRGYPRMTWDVCSALEESSAAGIPTDVQSVDAVVQRIYFADVEMPPVDHIKRLTEESSEIRDALISIHYGRSEGVSEATRTKLYLAGITRMVPLGKAIYFKNKVLEEALNEGYLLSVTKRSTTSRLSFAIGYIDQGAFNAGISELNAIEEVLTGDDLERAQLARGKALIGLEYFEEASASVQELLSSENSSLVEEASFLMGVALLQQGYGVKAMPHFNLASKSSGSQSLFAKIAYSQCAVRSSIDVQVAESDCVRIISEPSELLNSAPNVWLPAEALAYAYLTIADLHIKRAQRDSARRNLEMAEKFATSDQKVRFYLMQAGLASGETKNFWLRKSAQIIQDCSEFVKFSTGKLSGISINLLTEYLIRSHQKGSAKSLGEVIERVFKPNQTGLSVEQVISELVNEALLRNAKWLILLLLEKAVVLDDSKSSSRISRTAVGMLILNDPNRSAKYWDAYLKMFTADPRPYLSEYAVLNNLLTFNVGVLSPASVNFVLRLISTDPVDSENMSDSELSSLELLRRYLITFTALKGSPDAGTGATGKKLLGDFSKISTFDLPGFGANYVRLMQDSLLSRLRKQGITIDVRGGEKIGRNELIEVEYSGELRKGKFKKFEADLKLGHCQLIGRVTN